MRVEDTLQYMADFYKDAFPTRKHALNYLFCVVDNGYEWVNGELVDDKDKYEKRYSLRELIEKAEFDDEELWHQQHNLYKEFYEKDESKIPFDYRFEWEPISEEHSYLYNYPDNITSEWLQLINECKEMLVADGIEI